MQRNEIYAWNKYSACKSLPNLLFSSKSSQTLQLRRSQSLPSCFKFVQENFPYHKRTSTSNRMTSEKNPTIGELLGDDDLFHNRYHHHYSSSRSKRKRHHHHYQSYSRSSSIHVHYGLRKQQRSMYSNTTKGSQLIESMQNTHQVYPYSTAYNYTPLPAYCYYCYANMTSCCPCLISDCYGRLYQQETYYETSTS
jgi:hypothetical protein